MGQAVAELFARVASELDQGALLRLLGEMPVLPTALLDPQHVSWTAVDDAARPF